MLFKKSNDKTTLWVWTSADGKWTSRHEAEQNIDSFLSEISELEGVKIFCKEHHVKQWKDKSVTDYYYTKLSFPKAINNSVMSAVTSGLSISHHYPFEHWKHNAKTKLTSFWSQFCFTINIFKTNILFFIFFSKFA